VLSIWASAQPDSDTPELIRDAAKQALDQGYTRYPPSNPTGAIFDETILPGVADLAIENDVWMLADEPYEHRLYDGHRHISIASLSGMAKRTISAFTLSKSYAMTGWRVGYTAAPKPIIDEMEKLMAHTVDLVPGSIFGRAGEGYARLSFAAGMDQLKE
jgi:aspartate/methionine/tyrosine aminotransferase